MTEDEAAEMILSQVACYMTGWRITEDRDGHFRDATEDEATILDRVKRMLGSWPSS